MDTVKISGMSCDHCKSAVKSALEGLGLKNVEVDLAAGAASFEPDVSVTLQAVREAVEDAGFDVVAG